MMNNNKLVIMAEFSDVRYDARVIKEAQHLANRNFIVKLYMYNTDIKRDITYKKGNIIYNVYSFPSRRRNDSMLGIFKKYYEALYYLIRINTRILISKAEYYHAHNLKFLLCSFLSSMFHGSRLVYDAHELHSEHYDDTRIINRFRNKANMLLERLVLLKCHAFIQASEERAYFISEKYGIDKPIVINNYVPIYKIPPPKTQELRVILKIKNNYPIIFYSGGVYDDRFVAFEKVLKSLDSINNVNLVIVGFMNNDLRNRFNNYIIKFGLQDRVFLINPVPNDKLIKLSSSADIGLIPLTGESINTKLSALNKVSEYLMSGLPILCSNYENLTKIIYKNPIGIVGETFDILNKDSIKNAIKKMVLNSYYKQLKENAYQLAYKYYNWEKEAIKLDKIYATNNPTT